MRNTEITLLTTKAGAPAKDTMCVGMDTSNGHRQRTTAKLKPKSLANDSRTEHQQRLPTKTPTKTPTKENSKGTTAKLEQFCSRTAQGTQGQQQRASAKDTRRRWYSARAHAEC